MNIKHCVDDLNTHKLRGELWLRFVFLSAITVYEQLSDLSEDFCLALVIIF